MKSPNPPLRFLYFTAVGFGPLILAYTILVFGLLLNVAIALGTSFKDSLQFAFATGILIASLIVSLLIGFYAFQKSRHWLLKAFILYAFWLILVIAPAYFLTTSMAGVSMAAVDGGVSRQGLVAAGTRQAINLVAFAQFGIIPWVLGAAWVMGRSRPGQSS